MKKFLCLVLCVTMTLSLAFAETADTLPKRFTRQMTGGNGIRGYVNVTASGVADWLNLLLPFTATQIEIRAIGEKQGDMSENVPDDDDWQVRFYAKNSAGEEVGTTWLYGNPEGIYFQSELLPDTLLSLPVSDVNLLYQLLRGDFDDLFFAFDPLSLKAPGANGNTSAYEAIANLLGIPSTEWENDWMPVLEKYFLHLDLWLNSYGESAIITGQNGGLTMSATYRIPAKDFKAEAKSIIGLLIYDHALQNLLLPYVTLEQRVTYLNPSMMYFYEACIDALPLNGDIIFSREMSALGDIVGATVSLPIPPLPDTIATPIGEAVAFIFDLPYTDLLAGVDRVTIAQNGKTKSVEFSGSKRKVALAADFTNPDENTTAFEGSIRIQPESGAVEAGVDALLKGSVSHRIWQDEEYKDHDTSTISISVHPDAEKMVDGFKPVSLDYTVDYRFNSHKEESAVQINYTLDAQLPDAAIQADAVLRITPLLSMVALPTEGAENVQAMDEARKTELMELLVSNAVLMMSNLSAPQVEATAIPSAEPEAAPTAVPPMAE